MNDVNANDANSGSMESTHRPLIGTPPNRRSVIVVVSLLLLGIGLSVWAIRGGPDANAQPAIPAVDPTFTAQLPPVATDVSHGKMLQQLNCVGCHAVEGRLTGPSYTEIVAHYGSSPNRRASIVQAILHPSPGFSNYSPGPDESYLSIADRAAITDWMLSLKSTVH